MLNQSLVMTALLAGVAGGSHCIGMCGGIATLLAKPIQARPPQSQQKVIPISSISTTVAVGWLPVLLLHLGRLFIYAIAGAVVGSLGAAGLLFKPFLPVQSILFYLGNFSLIFLGLKCIGSIPDMISLGRVSRFFNEQLVSRFMSLFRSIHLPQHHFVRGMLWGCLPCGLVYAVLPIALISGAAWSGALLMVCFGVGALPYLLLTQGLTKRFGIKKPPMWIAIGAAVVLISLGMLGLFLPNEHHNAGWWC